MLFFDCHLSLVGCSTWNIWRYLLVLFYYVPRGTMQINYLPIITSKMFTSLGDTPGIRLACAMVSGSVLMSF